MSDETQTTREQAEALLAAALGNPNATFRERQFEAIQAVVDRKARILVVERTGWGKSYVYFIATRLLRNRGAGPTLIISPLLALMRNQIEAAKGLNLAALTINSTNPKEWPELIERTLSGHADVILISPERLANERFVKEILLTIGEKVGLLVVDEAHCVSDWGHDFRPDYRRIVEIVRRSPKTMPILATTATANNRVIEDLVGQIGNLEVQRGPLARETLELQTIRLPDQASRLAWLAQNLSNFPGTGIVYVLTHRDADVVAGWLSQNGMEARAYYGGVEDDGFETSNDYRKHLEGCFGRNELKALVATSALGMGYDKPDLGFVVHYQAPGSIIDYYQQAGRAGRAIKRAVCVLMAGVEDQDIHNFFRETAFPTPEQVEEILSAIEQSDGLTDRDLEKHVNLRTGQIGKVMKFLSVQNPSPIFKDGRNWVRTPVPYEMDLEHIKRLTEQREQEWEELQSYIDSDRCLMVHLAEALDDPEPVACGKCARCRGEDVVPSQVDREVAAEAVRFLQKGDMSLQLMKQSASGGFPAHELPKANIPPDLRGEEGRILSRWNDAGWGTAVVEDYQSGLLREDLIDAVVEMVQERWRPSPFPEWVAAVPSLRKDSSVEDAAIRVAERLGLPFHRAIDKVRENEPQRLQKNRTRQCQNLNGAFEVEEPLPSGPVLLVDDFVRSKWTLTLVSALLRQAGSGPVWPVAFTSRSTSAE